MYFNWRTGITTISIITETIQLAIMYFSILILKCLKTHVGNIRSGRRYNNGEEERAFDNEQFPSTETINELKGKSFVFVCIHYQLWS